MSPCRPKGDRYSANSPMPELARGLHTRTLMSLQHLWAGALLATTLGSVMPVRAQTGGTGAVSTGTGGIAVYVASVNGIDNRETDGAYLGIAECAADVEVRFLLASVPGGKTLID